MNIYIYAIDTHTHIYIYIYSLPPYINSPFKFEYVYQLSDLSQFHIYKFYATFEYFFIKIDSFP